MKILIVTDAWSPQTNGVVTTVTNIVRELEKKHEVLVMNPQLFRTVPLWPYYPDIKLAYNITKVGKVIKDFDPDTIHICTEGPLGIVARNFCRRHKLPFTTSFHTKFPEYLNKRVPIPVEFSYEFIKQFHNSAEKVLVTTEKMKAELKERGFKNLVTYPLGIDHQIFHSRQRRAGIFPGSSHKIKNLLYVGRVALEKNIEEFCKLSRDKRFQCWVVGDGPIRERLEEKWAGKVHFLGHKGGAVLAQHYASADVCVFPSRTDTFGLTIIESMACGTPVAGYPVTGPKDLILEGVNGSFHRSLKQAVDNCLRIDRSSISKTVARYHWKNSAKEFLSHMAWIGGNEPKKESSIKRISKKIIKRIRPKKA